MSSGQCGKCGQNVPAVMWSDWSEQYLCEQCEETENREMMNDIDPKPLWEPSNGNAGIILSKVNGWVRVGNSYRVFVDGSENPFTVGMDEYPSFLKAVKAYWS